MWEKFVGRGVWLRLQEGKELQGTLTEIGDHGLWFTQEETKRVYFVAWGALALLSST